MSRKHLAKNMASEGYPKPSKNSGVLGVSWKHKETHDLLTLKGGGGNRTYYSTKWKITVSNVILYILFDIYLFPCPFFVSVVYPVSNVTL